jgi:hypothetical protein
MRTISVLPSRLVSALRIIPHPFALLPQLANQAREAFDPDWHLERVLLHVDALDS